MTATALTVGRCRSLLLVALMTAAAALVVVPSAQAADDASGKKGEVTWSVRPSTPKGPDGRDRFDVKVAGGTEVTDWVAVTNFSPRKATFRVYATDATTDYDTGTFTLIGADRAPVDLGGWTSIDGGSTVCPSTGTDAGDQAEADCAAKLGTRVTLAAGERADIPFTIAVPHDATPGDHAAGIVASYASKTTDAKGAQVNVEQRVGTRIYLRVKGDLSPGLGVTGTVAGYGGTANPIGSGTGQVGFDVTNTGNVRLDANPVVKLSGLFGLGSTTVTLDPVRDLVPGGVAHVSADLPGVSPLLLLSANVQVTPAPAEGGGKNDAKGAAPTTASARAWAVPWTLLGLIVLVVAAGWLTIVTRRRSRRLLGAELAAYTEQIRAEALNTPSSAVRDESETIR